MKRYEILLPLSLLFFILLSKDVLATNPNPCTNGAVTACSGSQLCQVTGTGATSASGSCFPTCTSGGSSACQNGGICNSGVCTCTPNFQGNYCEYRFMCNSGGVCNTGAGGGTCTSTGALFGAVTEYQCTSCNSGFFAPTCYNTDITQSKVTLWYLRFNTKTGVTYSGTLTACSQTSMFGGTCTSSVVATISVGTIWSFLTPIQMPAWGMASFTSILTSFSLTGAASSTNFYPQSASFLDFSAATTATGLTHLSFDNNIGIGGTFTLTGCGCVSSITTLSMQLNSLTTITLPSMSALTSLSTFSNFNAAMTWVPNGSTSISTLQIYQMATLSPSFSAATFLGSALVWSSLTSLQIYSVNMGGSIPSTIHTALPSLTSIKLSYAGLTGSIPAQIGAYTTATVVDLSGNSLSGAIPVGIGALTTVTTLSLGGNALTGFPTQLATMTALVNLNLSSNPLATTFPVISQSTLRTVNVSNCQLTGTIPTQLATTAMTSLDFSVNSFTGGPLFATYTATASLTFASYAHNGLTGTINSNIGFLTSLTHLDFSHNNLGTSVPTQIALSPLTYLDISANPLITSIPTILCSNAANLLYLDISTCTFIASLYSYIGQYTNLAYLGFSGCGLTGALPTQIGALTKLTSMNMFGNNFNAALVSNIGSLTLLTYLDMHSSVFTGSLPTQIGLLTQLTYWDVSGNAFAAGLPSTIGGLTNLVHFDFSNSQMTGTIPTQIGLMAPLQYFGANLNSGLTNCPSNIFSLTSLTYINFASNNGMSITLGSTLGNLVNLQHLEMSLLSISGTIPTQIGSLTQLTTIIMSACTLQGSIPSQIGLLTQLTNLQLNSNTLSGSIPTQVVALTNLKNVVLYGNSLTGALSLASIQFLAYIDISQNTMSGTLSLGSTVGGSVLTYISFYQNSFTALVLPSSLPAITTILGYSNKLTGTLPNLSASTTLTMLSLSNNLYGIALPTNIFPTSLTFLNISNIGITGAYPTQIGLLIHLITLDIRANSITGSFPSQLTLLPLAYLDMSYNSITGIPTVLCSVPASLLHLDISYLPFGASLYSNIGGYPNLVYLGMSGSGFTGSLPTQIASLTQLTTLKMFSNNFNVGLITNLGLLTKLTYLDMHTSLFTGTLPTEMGLLTNLQYLDLSTNHFTTFPTTLGLLTQMVTLNISATTMGAVGMPTQIGGLVNLVTFNWDNAGSNSRSLPTQVGLWAKLQYFSMQNSAIINAFPTLFCSLTPLRHLDLSSDKISGTLPTCLGLLINLQYLDVSSGSITGSIPTQFGQLSKLTFLNLATSVGMSGTIPTELGLLTSLSYMGLSSMQLTGSIPTQFGQLTSLTSLYLFSNSLTGPIPTQIGFLTKLQILYLYFNTISGTLPSQLINLQAATQLALDANSNTGAIPDFFTVASNFPVLTLLNLAQAESFNCPLPNYNVFASTDYATYGTPSCASCPTCINGGTCIQSGSTCVCTANYNGTTCQNNINECISSPCQNAGTCTNGINSYSCACVAGWTGTTCSTQINFCTSAPCLNGGTCNQIFDGFTCNCTSGFNGTTCANDYSQCIVSKCGAFGSCNAILGGFTCTCTGSYTGTYCDSISLGVYQFVAGSTNYADPSTTTAVVQFNGADSYVYNTLSVYDNYILAGMYYNKVGSIVKQGSAYFYNCQTLPCSLAATFSGSSSGTNAYFGTSGDLNANFMVVGSPNNNGAAGSVHLFTYTSSSVAEVATFTGSLGASGDYFGNSIAVSENGLVVIGAPLATVSGNSQAGRAYVFMCNKTVCSQQDTPLPASGQAAGDNFGWTVASYENIIVVASPYKTSTSGNAYIYDCTSFPCTQASVLFVSSGANIGFGFSVSIWGSLVVVGAPYSGQGTVYVYSCTVFTSCSLLQQLTAPDGVSGDQFGISVSVFSGIVTVGNNFHNTYTGEVYSWDCNYTPCQVMNVGQPSGGLVTNQYYGSNVMFRDDLVVAGYWGQSQGGFYTLSLTSYSPCTSTPCVNAGTCTASGYTYSCACVAGWSGVNCQIEINQCTLYSPCQNGATCNELVNNYTCSCIAGWTDRNCSTEINNCAVNPCLNGGSCNNLVNSYTCSCVEGWIGSTCAIFDPNPCTNGVISCSGGTPYCKVIGTGQISTSAACSAACTTTASCSNNGVCVSGVCSCNANAQGNFCEYRNMCNGAGGCNSGAGGGLCTSTGPYYGVITEYICQTSSCASGYYAPTCYNRDPTQALVIKLYQTYNTLTGLGYSPTVSACGQTSLFGGGCTGNVISFFSPYNWQFNGGAMNAWGLAGFTSALQSFVISISSATSQPATFLDFNNAPGLTGLTTLSVYSNSWLTGTFNLTGCAFASTLVTLNIQLNNLQTISLPSLPLLTSIQTYNNSGASLSWNPSASSLLTQIIIYGMTAQTSPSLSSSSFLGSATVWTNLNSFLAKGTQMYGSIPTTICSSLPALQKINLSGCMISGSIPTQIALCSSLTFLELSLNEITGSIPTQLAAMSKLVTLNLGSDSLSGTIPSQLSAMTSATYIDFSNNGLTGTIPSFLGANSNMPSLITLNLDQNAFNCQLLNYSVFPVTDYSTAFATCSLCPTCQNGGICVQTGNYCTCTSNFNGTACQNNINECISNPCQNAGTCVNGINSFTCICVEGWSGTTCTTEVNDCTVYSPCQNGATCAMLFDNYTCSCVPGYSGRNCSILNNNCVPTNPCLNGGTCNNMVNSYNCTCMNNFNGTICQNDYSHCVSNPCVYNTACTPLNNTFSCACTQGLTGTTCSIDNSVCSAVSCSPAGISPCYSSGYMAVCNCTLGLTGNCQSPNPCSLNPCQNGGTCYTYLSTSQYCVCASGWYGPYCAFIYKGAQDVFLYFQSMITNGLAIYGMNGRMDLCGQINAHGGAVGECVGGGIDTILVVSSVPAGVGATVACEGMPLYISETGILTSVQFYSVSLIYLSQDVTNLIAGAVSSLETFVAVSCVFPQPYFIPSNIGLLSHLSTLTITTSNVIGIIPTQLSQIAGLSNINLSSNKIYGTVPQSLITKTTHGAFFLYPNLFSCPVNNYSVSVLSPADSDYNDFVSECTTCDAITCMYYEKCVIFEGQGLCVPDCDGNFPCENGGTCITNSTTGIPSCTCASNFNGTICQNDFSRCGYLPCFNGATCIPKNSTYLCDCAPGFNGTNCQNDFTGCFSNPCAYQTVCAPYNNTYGCSCTSGLKGQQCSIDTETCTAIGPCSPGIDAGCYASGYRAVCNCTGGATNNCAVSCSTNPCLNGGTCTVFNSSPTQHFCNCAPSYYGPYCASTREEQQDLAIWILGTTLSGNASYSSGLSWRKSLCSQTGTGSTSITCNLSNNTLNSITIDSGVSAPTYLHESFQLNFENAGNLETMKWIGVHFSFFTENINNLIVYTSIEEIIAIGSRAPGNTIPTEIGYGSYLTTLVLPSMGLIGSIPTQITAYRLTDIELQGNMLTGPLHPLLVTPSYFEIESTLYLYPNLMSCPIYNYSTDTSNDYSSYKSACSAACPSACPDFASVCIPLNSTTGLCVPDCFGDFPCENGGTCIANSASGITSCQCVTGYNGTICENDFHKCEINQCINGGTCIPNNGSFVCSCLAGFTGNVCQNDFHDCESNPCINGGTCTPSNYSYSCNCTTGFNGTQCENDFHRCVTNPCLYGGVCVPSNYSFSCNCPAGLSGVECEIDSDVCETVSCDPLSIPECNPFNELVACSCNSSNPENNCDHPDPCSINPCQNGGTCMVFDGDLRFCHCPLGVSGVYCSFPFVEQADLHSFMTGLTLDNIPAATYNARTNLCGQMAGNTSIVCDIYGRVNSVYITDPQIPGTTFSQTVPYYIARAIYIDTLVMSTSNMDFFEVELASATSVPLSKIIINEGMTSYTIPTTIGLLRGLTHLEITNTLLYGTIPTELGTKVVTYINLQNNYLTGPIPSQIITARGSGQTTLLLSNNILYCPLRDYSSVPTNDYYSAKVSCDMSCPGGGGCSYNEMCVDYYGVCEVDCAVSFPCQHNGVCTFSHDDYTESCVCPNSTYINGTQCESSYMGCFTESPLCINGGTCQATNNSFNCLCLEGWNGTYCENDYSICLDDNQCINGGTCTPGNFSFSCACQEGFSGNLCQDDFHRCLSSPCMNGQTCTPGNYTFDCDCDANFNGTFCQYDINECRSSPCNNAGTCVNGIDSYTCLCKENYFAGPECQYNINMCGGDVFPCENSAECYSLFDDYMCVCSDGYTGKNCSDLINNCNPNHCENNSTCVNGVAEYSCTCNPGFSGQNCEIDNRPCATPRCFNGGTCNNIDVYTMYNCTCPTNYTGALCGFYIPDCSPSPCLHGSNCSLVYGGFQCVGCDHGWEGATCETQINNCNPDPCQHNSPCTNLIGDYNCSCVLGVTGKNCSAEVNFCINNTCLNGASCQNNPFSGGYSCLCSYGYTGTYCETEVFSCDIDKPCLNGGKCSSLPWSTSQDFEYYCACLPNYSGPNCQTQLNACQVAYGNGCQRGSTCIPGPNMTYTCSCINGFTGPLCDVQINNCNKNSCSGRGVCENIIAGVKCNCDGTGFVGTKCQFPINDCIVNKCTHGSNCIDGINNYTCRCNPGYEGVYCQNITNNCSPVNPCLNSGVCTSKLGNFSCDCTNTGYNGTTCANYIDNCAPMPCYNGGECQNKISGFSCSCLTGTTGTSCETINSGLVQTSMSVVDNTISDILILTIEIVASSVFDLSNPSIISLTNQTGTVSSSVGNRTEGWTRFSQTFTFFISGSSREQLCELPPPNEHLIFQWKVNCSTYGTVNRLCNLDQDILHTASLFVDLSASDICQSTQTIASLLLNGTLPQFVASSSSSTTTPLSGNQRMDLIVNSDGASGTLIDSLNCSGLIVYIPTSKRSFVLMEGGYPVGPFARVLDYRSGEQPDTVSFFVSPGNFMDSDYTQGTSIANFDVFGVCVVGYSALVSGVEEETRKRGILRSSQSRKDFNQSIVLKTSSAFDVIPEEQAITTTAVVAVIGTVCVCAYLASAIFKYKNKIMNRKMV